MKRSILSLLAMLAACSVLVSCASTKVSDREILVNSPLPKPGQLVVYDFAFDPKDVPADSVLAKFQTAPTIAPTPEQAATAKKLGSLIATELISQIREMGLNAVAPGVVTQPKDCIIRGYLVSIDEGSTLKRITIGFGAGAAELKTLVEGFQVTADGERRLGYGVIDASGSKAPGGAFGVAALVATGNPIGLVVQSGLKATGELTGYSTVEGRAKQTAKEISEQLKIRFKDLGWIQ
jgi:hypothetical protein